MGRKRRRPDHIELSNEFSRAHLDVLVTREVAAAGAGYATASFEVFAWNGEGPPYTKRPGGRCLYKKSDVIAWMEGRSQQVKSTSQYLPTARGYRDGQQTTPGAGGPTGRGRAPAGTVKRGPVTEEAALRAAALARGAVTDC